MRIKLLPILACLSILLGACGKTPMLTDSESGIGETATYTREGVTPFTITASCETRSVLGHANSIRWDQGDGITLLKKGDSNVQLLDAVSVGKMTVGEKKSILLVNPSNDGGYFMGFDSNSQTIIRNSEGLSSDNLSGGDIAPDVAESNLKAISELALPLCDESDFIFTLERVDDGWLLYHKASGIGLSSKVGSYSSGRYSCVLNSSLGAVDIQDGSKNLASTSNTVTGRKEQIWIKKVGDPCADFFLWSGGSAKPLSWNGGQTQWTNWLFFELPDTGSSYLFTADESGTSSTFTNNTGFTAGNDQWFALYPSAANPSFNGEELKFTLPEVQFYQADSFGYDANVAAGILQDDRVFFRSVCGILKISLQGTQRVRSITVKDKKGASLWGSATLKASSIDSGDCIATVSGGSDQITLNCRSAVQLKEDSATDFYIVVPAGAFSAGFDVEIATPSGTFTRSTSKDNTIKRADIKQMPAFMLEKAPVDPTEVNVENKAVQAYMSYGRYDSFGAGSSYLDYQDVRSLRSTLEPNAHLPAGFTVTWDSEASASITVTEDGKTWYTEDGITGGTYTITNMTPGCTYTYSVNENGTLVAEGELNAVGQVRMVSITDAWNCRDLGGWTGLNGKTIKYGKLYRTASLNGEFVGTSSTSDMDYADPSMYIFRAQDDIDRLGIQAELDLRGDPYSGIVGDWGSEGTDHSASLRQTRLKGADFMRIMTDYGLIYPTQRSSLVQDVAWIIQELKLGKPVAFHCRIGADRTGALSYVIEALLGVHEGDVARDYELTSFAPKSGNRYASRPNQTFFSQKFGFVAVGDTFQERCYYYLNQYFDDVHINADDLDWFICEMLGLESYEHPKLAKNYENNSLETVYSIMTGTGSPDKPSRRY